MNIIAKMTIGKLGEVGELRMMQVDSRRTDGSPTPRQGGRASSAHHAPGGAASRRVHNQWCEDLRF